MTIDPLRDLSFAIAYRMLGTVSEAEDVVQEALLRLHAAEGVENREAFLTTVTTRLAIDVLRSARVRRETYTGAWLPEPLVEDAGLRAGRGRGGDLARVPRPARAPHARRARRARPARLLRLLVRRDRGGAGQVRGQLPPDPQPRPPPHRRGAAALRRRPRAAPHARRALPRGRARGRHGGPRRRARPGAVLVGDGGGKARALPRPLVGAEAIARAFRAFARMAADWGVTFEPVLVNGQPGVRALAPDGRPRQRRSRSTSPTAPCSASTRCSTPTSSATSARSRTWPAAPGGAVSRTHMTHGTPRARPMRGDGIVLSMLNTTSHSRSRRTMDHSHRVAVVREIPRPAAALGGTAW